MILHRVHAQVGADVVIYLAARHRGKRIAHRGGHGLEVGLAAVEYLDRAGLDKLAVMPGQLLVVDVLGLALAAEAADGEVLIAAHLLYAARESVAALVVHAAADDVKELFTLTVHILRQQQAAARRGVEQQLCHERAGVAQQRLAPGQIVRLREAAVKADALYFAYAPHDRLHRRAVKLIHPARQLLHISVARSAAAQHKGYDRVHRRGLAPQLREQRDAHAGGLEFVGTQMTQKHAGHKLVSVKFHVAPPRFFLSNYTTR